MKGPVEIIKDEKKLLLQHYLDENKDQYKTVFTSNPDSMFVLDIEGYFMNGNLAFNELSGYPPEEVQHLRLQSLFPLDHVNKVFHHFHKTMLGQIENFDCKMTNKYGQVVDLNITNMPICVDDQVVGILAVGRDITALKRKKEEIRKIEEIQRLLTDNAHELIICTNLQGDIHYVSPSGEHILGYSNEEVINQNCFAYLHPDDVEKAHKNWKKVLSSLEVVRDCYRFYNKQGQYIWIDTLNKPIVDPETCKVLEVVSLIRDISVQARAEEEAKKQEDTYRDLVEKLPDAVIIARGNKILYVNDTGVQLFGAKSKGELLRKKVVDIIHPDYHEEARTRANKVVRGEATNFFEYKLIRLDGTIFEAEIKGIPSIFQSKPARHIIIRDTTERKKTQELLLNSEKLSVAGQLAAGIAHEVRNPLTAIKGFMQLLEAQFGSNKTYFDIIQSEMDRIELILSELLVLAKPHELKYEQVDLITLVESVKTLINTQAIMKGIEIELIYSCDHFFISCDENQLKQVFINILKNAVEAMPGGGVITIELKLHGSDMVKIFFKDAGKGMPPQVLKRIGEPFFTTKKDGTGLGIMISKQIIENHGGTIHFWSDQQGTMIEVILPIEKNRHSLTE